MKEFLDMPISSLAGIGPPFAKKLERLGLLAIKDLLYHFPSRYEDYRELSRVEDLTPGGQAAVQGQIRSVNVRRAWRRRMMLTEAVIEDSSGSVRAVWFHQPYLKNILRIGKWINIAGKVSNDSKGLLFAHPSYEVLSRPTDGRESSRETRHTGRLIPIYPETRGITSRGIRYAIQPVLKNLPELSEWIPKEILKKNNFPNLNEALRLIHFPNTHEEAERARSRFAFENLFLLQILNLEQKYKFKKEKAPCLSYSIPETKEILELLPFSLTTSQKRSLWEIMQDMAKDFPMNRLLQGDVGSGKTIVAALSALIAAKNGYQTAFMAPTEVLARQHYETFKKLFAYLPRPQQAPVGLLTASQSLVFYENDLEAKLKKDEFKEEVKKGQVKIVIGTHALIAAKESPFDRLGLVVIDEQHRFGVRQRHALINADKTQINADDKQNDKNSFLYEGLTYKIRNAVFAVYNSLGAGHKEKIYQNALEEEFKKLDIQFEKEKSIQIKYHEKNAGIYQPDFVIDKKIILEIKALPFLGEIEKKQIWTYLRGSFYKLALLINFGQEKLEIKRVIYDVARGDQRSSAANQRPLAFLPHFLTMSATPIPRTLILTVFGDLDLSTITELPAGRKKIITKAIPPEDRSKAYEFIRLQIKSGRQAFVICPRIEMQTNTDGAPINAEEISRMSASGPRESAFLLEAKSVKEEYEKLSQKVFPEFKIAMLHGKLRPKEKDKIMTEFREGKIQLLISTSVIEVGVDIPNASIMMIEGSERFGLAQLYQFRGRVGRGGHQSYCFLLTDSSAAKTEKRLKAIVTAKNGFELAEEDLKLRGPGEFLGTEQTGFPDTLMRGLQNPELIKTSRESAASIMRIDPALNKFPQLKSKLEEFKKQIHLE